MILHNFLGSQTVFMLIVLNFVQSYLSALLCGAVLAQIFLHLWRKYICISHT